MAAVGKQTFSKPKQHRLPTKMGSRTQEVRAVGAWVQPEQEVVLGEVQMDAVRRAEAEEVRLRERQQEKAERLRQFQKDVKERVQAMERARREEALRKSYRAVELERNVVRQTAYAAEKSTPRKNRCSVRENNNLRIRHTATVNKQGGVISDHEEDKGKDAQFEEQTHTVKKLTRQARHRLTSRKIPTDHYIHSEMPGGSCHEAASLDDEEKYQSDKENDEANVGVRFAEVVDEATDPEEETAKSAPQPPSRVPNIYPGVQSEEERIRAQNQRAMYRRLFMDIEREQVKENQRRRQHQKTITDLKKAAEEERLRVEAAARDLTAPKDAVTGETEAELTVRLRAESQIREARKEEASRMQKQRRENDRFLEALKMNLRDKIDKQKMDLPPLCLCGSSLWDTNPDTCANNCVFYHNPKAYARALQSLLASCDVV